MLIFSFFGQICRVNNLATVRSITWPHFLQKNWKMWPSYWPYSFHMVFWYNLLFFQKSHSPCRKKRIFEKQKTTKKTIKKVAKLLTYGGQVIKVWKIAEATLPVSCCPLVFLWLTPSHVPALHVCNWQSLQRFWGLRNCPPPPQKKPVAESELECHPNGNGCYSSFSEIKSASASVM